MSLAGCEGLGSGAVGRPDVRLTSHEAILFLSMLRAKDLNAHDPMLYGSSSTAGKGIKDAPMLTYMSNDTKAVKSKSPKFCNLRANRSRD